MANKNERLIKYLGLGYPEFTQDQLKWAEIYFKEQAKDLTKEASSGRMMIDLNAFIGDVLSFYIEDRFRNSNLETANNINSIVDIGYSQGYKFKGPSAATDLQNFYIEVPATTGSAGNYIPDMRYAPNCKDVQLQSTNGVVFEALGDVDFSAVNISSSIAVKVSKRNSSGIPTHFTLKQTQTVMAGKTVTETFNIGQYEANRTITLSNKNVLDIVSVTDSSGEKWEEVEYLVQDVVFEGKKNTGTDSLDVPYVLKIKSVPKRFITKVDPRNGTTALTFGNGKTEDIGDSVVPDPSLIALNLKGKLSFSPAFVDPQDFLKNRNLGLAPYNTTLTIKSRVGGGKITNTAANSLNSIISKTIDMNTSGLSVSEINNTLSSLSTRNLTPIEGGDDAPPIEDLKFLIGASFAAQGRVNTRQDYIARIMSMPSIFGQVFRVSPINNCAQDTGIQIYLLAKNAQNQISVCSDTMKKNIKQYLSVFTRMNQGTDLLDGEIINIGIDYTIVVSPGYNKSQVKLATLLKVKDMFKIENWQMRQPINIDDIRCAIKETEGVYSISDLKIINKANIQNGVQYSTKVYDIAGNTRNNIVFCPSNAIFEVKNPNSDIKVGAI